MNMMSGLFRGRPLYTPPSQATINAYLDEFADWLSRDLYSLPEICRRMDITGGTGAVLLTMLCQRYGEPVSL